MEKRILYGIKFRDLSFGTSAICVVGRIIGGDFTATTHSSAKWLRHNCFRKKKKKGIIPLGFLFAYPDGCSVCDVLKTWYTARRDEPARPDEWIYVALRRQPSDVQLTRIIESLLLLCVLCGSKSRTEFFGEISKASKTRLGRTAK